MRVIQPGFWNLRTIRIINALLLAIMVACTIHIVRLVGRQIAPDWDAPALLLVTGLVAMAAYRERIRRADRSPFSPFGLKTTVTEWIVILVLLKLISFWGSSFSQVWENILGWSTSFWSSFFTPGYTSLVVFAVLAHVLSGVYAEQLINLENDTDLLDQEKGGIPGGNRMQAYSMLTGVVFAVGGLLMGLMALLSVKFSSLPINATTILRPDVLALMVYFVAGFILLALGRYSMKEAHWYLLDIQSDRRIGMRWILASAVMLILLGGLVWLLPTNYSVGLFDTLRQVFAWLVSFLVVFFGLIVAFFAFIFSYFARLLGISSEVVEMPEMDQPIVVPTTQPEMLPELGDNSAIAIAKTVLFWVVFLLILIFAIRTFVLSNRVNLGKLHRPLWLNNVVKAWTWLKKQFNRVGQQAARIAQAGVERLQGAVRKSQVLFERPIAVISRALPARQRVMMIYTSLLKGLEKNGIERWKSETPAEYARRAGDVLVEAGDELTHATRIFVEARYSLHPVAEERVTQIQQYAERIQQAARMYDEARKLVRPENL